MGGNLTKHDASGMQQTQLDNLPTRHSLIDRARSDTDSPAWEDLLDYYAPFIDKILLKMGLRGADLEDVRQQVLLKLWQGLQSYTRGEGDGAKRVCFRNWLSTLIRNAAVDWFRSQRRNHAVQPLTSADEAAFDSEDSEIEGLIERDWQKHILTLAMQNLKVFALSLKGESVESIATSLDLRHESVYVLKTRVKTRLSQEIAQLRTELEGQSHD